MKFRNNIFLKIPGNAARYPMVATSPQSTNRPYSKYLEKLTSNAYTQTVILMYRLYGADEFPCT